MYGPRFTAFLPFGNRASIDYDIAYLGKRTSFGYSDIMMMPSSRRHRLVKLYEEIERQEANAVKQGRRTMSAKHLTRSRR